MTSKYHTIKVRLSLAKLHRKRQVRANTEKVKIIKVLVPTPQGFVLNKIPKPEHRKECFDVPQMESLSLVNCLFRFKEDFQHVQTVRICSFIRFLIFLKRQPLAF